MSFLAHLGVVAILGLCLNGGQILPIREETRVFSMIVSDQPFVLSLVILREQRALTGIIHPQTHIPKCITDTFIST
jgi:hypothetical protein